MASFSPQAWKVIPEFSSTSIAQTIAFYTTYLHFIIGGSHTPDDSAEATFCSLFKGKKAAANIYFRRCAPKHFVKSKAWVAMSTDALELFWEELKQQEVVIVEAIGDKEWGYRQFIVADPDGNEITFFRFLEGGNGEDDSKENVE